MNDKTAYQHSTPTANHCLDQTAASFGWTVEAAAGQALRSTDEAPGRIKHKVEWQLSREQLNGVTRGGTISRTIERLALHPAPGKAPRRSSTP